VAAKWCSEYVSLEHVKAGLIFNPCVNTHLISVFWLNMDMPVTQKKTDWPIYLGKGIFKMKSFVIMEPSFGLFVADNSSFFMI
jgi:hypothetical protein